jgi:hypothetical protein
MLEMVKNKPQNAAKLASIIKQNKVEEEEEGVMEELQEDGARDNLKVAKVNKGHNVFAS